MLTVDFFVVVLIEQINFGLKKMILSGKLHCKEEGNKSKLKFCQDHGRSCAQISFPFFGMSGRPCSQSPLGGRLATTFVDHYFHHSFLFSFFSFLFSPSSTFLIEGVLGS